MNRHFLPATNAAALLLATWLTVGAAGSAMASPCEVLLASTDEGLARQVAGAVWTKGTCVLAGIARPRTRGRGRTGVRPLRDVNSPSTRSC